MSFLWGDEHCVSVVSLRGTEPFKEKVSTFDSYAFLKRVKRKLDPIEKMSSNTVGIMPREMRSEERAQFFPDAVDASVKCLIINFYSFQYVLNFSPRPCFFILSGSCSNHEEIVAPRHNP